MSNYLEDNWTPPFKTRQRKYQSKDNFESLQNDERKEITEDFSDSPFADREDGEELLEYKKIL